MARKPDKAALFSSWLRGQMVQHNLSQRALGKLIDPENGERGRRQVIRHLNAESFPQARKRRLYLDAFGLEGDPFTDDEEEALDVVDRLHQIAQQHRALSRELNAALKAVRA